MQITKLDQGPYINFLGWTDWESRQACACPGAQWLQMQNPMHFTGDGGYECQPNAGAGKPTTITSATARSSGVARARSASKATVFAAILGNHLLQSLGEKDSRDGDRIGIAVASTSSITPIAWDFETTGLEKGWHRTDTMLLPSSIPSAITTQTSAALGIHSSAIAFQDGAFGICAALEYAHLSFYHGRAGHFLIIAAEEISEIQCEALTALGDNRPRLDGASGLLLGRAPLNEADWQLKILGNIPEGIVAEMDPDWQSATTQQVTISGIGTIFTSLVIPYAIHNLLKHADEKAMLVCSQPGRGRYFLGFARNQPAC